MSDSDNLKPARKPRTPKAEKETTEVIAPVSKPKAKETDSLSVIERMIKEINETEDKIDFDGKKYTTVAKRNEILRKHLGFNVKVITQPLKVEADNVVFECKIFVYQDSKWVKVATGHSEEHRSSSEINKVAALENAETSAIGRALANLGLTGGEYSTINELKSKTGIAVSPEVVKHVKEVLKLSGLEEKNVLAVYGIKSLDKGTPDTLFKIMSEALKTIEQKKNKPKGSNKEDEITL